MFRLFDIEQKGFLSLVDLTKAIKIFLRNEFLSDIDMLFRRFDADNDIRLNYQEFAAMLLPFNPEIARSLTEREPAYASIDDFHFAPATEKALQRTLSTQLSVAQAHEYLRQRLSSQCAKRHKSISDIYRALDFQKKQYLTIDDLGAFISRHKQTNSQELANDLELLLRKYDRDMDRRISYYEFINEMMPKSDLQASVHQPT